MSNATAEDFRRSLDQLVQQAQHTAQLGVNVARDQVESFVRSPNVSNLNVNEHVEDVRRSLQTMAREIETKAQELVHLASSYMQPGAAPSAAKPRTTVTTEPPTGHESHTAAGAGTPQHGSDPNATSHTPAGEAPLQ